MATAQFLQQDPVASVVQHDEVYERRVAVDGEYCFIRASPHSIIHQYYPSAMDQDIQTGDGFLLVYNMADRQSFERLDRYYQNILRWKNRSEFPTIVVAIHEGESGSERVISEAEGRASASAMGCQYIEPVLAKEGDVLNVDWVFSELVREIRRWARLCTCPVCKVSSTGGRVTTS